MNAITAYAKAHVALILAVLTWLVTALKDGTVSGQEWVGLPAAIITGLGVAAVRNRKSTAHNDAGYGLIELLVAVILLIVLVLLILWLIPHHH